MNSAELVNTVKTLVDNLEYSRLFRAVNEVSSKDIFAVKQLLKLPTEQNASITPVQLFHLVKQSVFQYCIHDSSLVNLLLELPQKIGFQVAVDQMPTEDNITTIALDSSISTLWLILIIKAIIGPSILPSELSGLGIGEFIKEILLSESSRFKISSKINEELKRRELHRVTFNIKSVLKGYNTEDAHMKHLIPFLLAAIIMASTGLQVDLDRILILDIPSRLNETTNYIFTTYTMKFIQKRILGDIARKPFDWPMVGDKKICSALMDHVALFERYASNLVTCPDFVVEISGQSVNVSSNHYTEWLLERIFEHYSDALKQRQGRGKNTELTNFIDILDKERDDIAKIISNEPEKGLALFRELTAIKKKSIKGYKPFIEPEDLFRESLQKLEMKLKVKSRIDGYQKAIAEETLPVFSAAVQVIEKYKDKLGEDIDKFTEALCFDTSFRILEYLDLGEYILDLPWVARLVSYEASTYDVGPLLHDPATHQARTERVASAYLGGVIYLILQSLAHRKLDMPTLR